MNAIEKRFFDMLEKKLWTAAAADTLDDIRKRDHVPTPGRYV